MNDRPFAHRLQIGNGHGEVTCPSFADVEAAVNCIDGGAIDSVVIEARDVGCYMGICGQIGGRYTVFVCNDRSYWSVIDPTVEAARMITIDFPGGQEVETPLRELVSLGVVLNAAQTYWQSGERDSSLHWLDKSRQQ